jgi:hypothetical protein
MCTLRQLAALGIAHQPTNHDTETVGAAAENPHWIATKKSTRIDTLDEGESMIEVLPDMPEGVTGIRVSGRLRGDDLREFKPAMEEFLKTGEIRIVEVVAPDYEGFGPGGLIEDLKLGLGALIEHHSAFKRIAIVSDKEWVAHALHAFAWMVPGELALFGLDELERAKEWAAG